jgi:hypothetical protein
MNKFQKLAAVAVIAAVPGISSAFTVYDGFGAFPDATWAGTGIPNDAVAASKQIVDGDTTIRIAMNATGRYSNPQLANNGAGTFYAGTGSNTGGNNESPTTGALWNWNYFMDITSGSGKVLSDYQIDIWYDFNPAGPTACCSVAGLGRINVTAALLAAASTSTLQQGSENLLFGYLAAPAFPQSLFITPPGGAFNPNAVGTYQFAITVSSGPFPLDSVAMQVQVVPVPAAAWLFGSALGLAGLLRRRAAA